MALQYRLAKLSDGPACNALYVGFYRIERSLAQWIWEFADQAFAGDDLPYAVAFDGDAPVATQALMPVRMIDRSGAFWSAKGEEALVSPRLWGQDVLRPLWNLLLGYAARHGIEMIWGFNRRRPVYEKLGFRYFAEPDCRWTIRPLDREGLPALAANDAEGRSRKPAKDGAMRWARAPLVGVAAAAVSTALDLAQRPRALFDGSRRIEVRPLEFDGPALEDLSRRFVARFGGVTTLRSADYLDWRLRRNAYIPSQLAGAYFDGRLQGLVAWSATPRRLGFISDMLVCARDDGPSDLAVARSLLAHATRHLKSAGVSLVRATIHNRHPGAATMLHAARATGYLDMAGRVGVCVRDVPGGPPRAGFDYDSWYLTHLNTEGRAG